MASLKSKRSLLRSTSPVAVAVQGERLTSGPLQSEDAEFERAWVFLAPSVARSGEHTHDSVLAALRRGTRRLWLTDECAVITEIRTFPSGLVVGQMWLGGGRLPAILALFPAMEAWMVAHGATESRIDGRRGWLRVTGYKELRTLIRKDLRHVAV